MNIGKWILGRLTKKLLPIITQVYVVLVAIDVTFKEILKRLPEVGIPTGTTIYSNIKMLSDAIYVVKSAVVQIITFLDGSIPPTHQGYVTLEDEIDKLKDMLV